MELKREHQIFVTEMIKHGDEVRAYKAAYPKAKNAHAIRKGCLRMSQNVSVQFSIKETAERIRLQAEHQATEALKDKIVGDTLTRQKKLEIVHQIATGALEIPVKKPVWDKAQNKYVLVPMVELPDHAARLKAIEVDNKMNGDNAPDKIISETVDRELNEVEQAILSLPLAERKEIFDRIKKVNPDISL
jgi:hypothetical protein